MLACKKAFEYKMEVTKMRMLRWMCGNTMMDMIKTQKFRDKQGVGTSSAMMRENRLRWFGQMQRKTFDALMQRIESIIVEGKRSQGRPRRMWEEQIKNNLYDLHPL